MDAAPSQRRRHAPDLAAPSTSPTTSCSRPASRCTLSTAASSPGRSACAAPSRARSSPPSTEPCARLDPDDLVVTDDTRSDRPRRRHGRRVDGDRPGYHATSCSRPPTGNRRRSPARCAGTSCRARRPSGSSAGSIRRSRPSRCSAASTCWSEHGGAAAAPGFTVVGPGPAPVEIGLRVERPARSPDCRSTRRRSCARLVQVGCTVRGADVLTVTPPSWRPDLTDPADLVEEVVRLVGYDRMPVGAAYSAARSRAGRRPAAAPHLGAGARGRRLHRGAELPVRLAVGASTSSAWPPTTRAGARCVVANPLSDAEPQLRTSLLPRAARDAHPQSRPRPS